MPLSTKMRCATAPALAVASTDLHWSDVLIMRQILRLILRIVDFKLDDAWTTLEHLNTVYSREISHGTGPVYFD